MLNQNKRKVSEILDYNHHFWFGVNKAGRVQAKILILIKSKWQKLYKFQTSI